MVSMIRLVVMAIRFMAPWVARAAGYTIRAIATAIGSLWVGVPTAVKRIADEWADRAERAGFPTAHIRDLHQTIQIVAFLIIVSAWVVFSFVTVMLITWII